MLTVYQKEKECCYNIWIWATLMNMRFALIRLRGRAWWLMDVQTKGIVSTRSKWTGDRCDQNVAIDVTLTLTRSEELIGQKSQNKSSSVICLTISYHGHSVWRIRTEDLKKTDGVGYCLSEFFKIQLSVAILIRFHDRLINDLLQLLVLWPNWWVQSRRTRLGSYLQIVAYHHLQHQKELSIGNESISIDIVYVEGN